MTKKDKWALEALRLAYNRDQQAFYHKGWLDGFEFAKKRAAHIVSVHSPFDAKDLIEQMGDLPEDAVETWEK